MSTTSTTARIILTASIKVPSTSANIGPGFDTLGLALSLYLSLKAVLYDQSQTTAISLKYPTTRTTAETNIPFAENESLIISTFKQVLREYQAEAIFATRLLELTIENEIPMGRGLGSSGAAIVAGVLLANVVGDLRLSQQVMLDISASIEGHQDNVAASLHGGLVITSLIPTTSPVKGLDGTIRCQKIDLSRAKLKAIAVIPTYEVKTKEARQVLPDGYSKADVVHNLQRLSLLLTTISQPASDPWLLYHACQDRLHQPYRESLIPGMKQLLQQLTPDSCDGVNACFLSGSGPTVLVLASHNFDQIRQKANDILLAENVASSTLCLDIGVEGASCITE